MQCGTGIARVTAFPASTQTSDNLSRRPERSLRFGVDEVASCSWMRAPSCRDRGASAEGVEIRGREASWRVLDPCAGPEAWVGRGRLGGRAQAPISCTAPVVEQLLPDQGDRCLSHRKGQRELSWRPQRENRHAGNLSQKGGMSSDLLSVGEEAPPSQVIEIQEQGAMVGIVMGAAAKTSGLRKSLPTAPHGGQYFSNNGPRRADIMTFTRHAPSTVRSLFS